MSDYPLDHKEFPSNHVHQLIVYFDKTLPRSKPLKLFMMCHGNVTIMLIGCVCMTVSMGFTITSSPSTYDLYYCTTWYFLIMSCTIYQLFWSRADPDIKSLLRTLSLVMAKVERQSIETDQPQMHKTWRRVKLMKQVMYSNHFMIAAIVSLRRIPDSKLPVSLRGLPYSNPWMITLQVIQGIINPPGLISASHFFETMITLVWCVDETFRVLSRRLANATSDDEVNDVVVLHGQLLDCCGKLIDIFEKWLFMITSSLFCVSLGVTMSMVMGVIDMENMLLLPGQLNSITILCLFGDQLQQSTESFANFAYSFRWFPGTARSRNLILMLISRAQKPLSLRCGVFGYLCFPTALSVYSTWYRFLNYLLNI